MLLSKISKQLLKPEQKDTTHPLLYQRLNGNELELLDQAEVDAANPEVD